MSEPGSGRVGGVARALGFAGLLPPLAIVALLSAGPDDARFVVGLRNLADVYAGIILSFLGGLWWSIAMRRTRGQGLLVTLAVLPHLVATREAPAGWMGLRIPLSLGLGLSTIAAGLLAR